MDFLPLLRIDDSYHIIEQVFSLYIIIFLLLVSNLFGANNSTCVCIYIHICIYV